jgi:hypothetical protein
MQLRSLVRQCGDSRGLGLGLMRLQRDPQAAIPGARSA